MEQTRYPIHVVYGGAHLFRADTPKKLSEIAIKFFKEFAPDPLALFEALDLKVSEDFAYKIHSRVLEKLKQEAVEDFRIDFEDGYGVRSDDEEDDQAKRAALEFAFSIQQKHLTPFCGIRIKSLSPKSSKRALRTLDIFCAALASKIKTLPRNFVVTLPKVASPKQVKNLVAAVKRIEKKHKWGTKSILLELMVETPNAIFDEKGQVALPAIVKASEGRCAAVHFGAYDYTASLDIVGSHQSMSHPACEFARQVMLVSLAGSGVRLSDGATTLLPVPPHRESDLTSQQILENREWVRRAWRLSAQNIRHSLSTGFYQGWDLHPSQIPIRFVATYIFFLESLEPMAKRFKNFMEQSKKATETGGHFDDAATGRGLVNFFIRGISCGAFTDAEIANAGVSLKQLKLEKL